jgi:catechol 2,3-dioxygenase-like lactoylglutathione lyase family enzyme
VSRSIRSLGRRLCATLLLALLSGAWPLAAQSLAAPRSALTAVPFAGVTAGARAVAMVGFTVADMSQSVAFYTQVLDFVKVSDHEVSGLEYEKLYGLSGARLRVVRLRLGDESLQLTEYLTPRGRAAPADSRSNDRWFQHVAIIVSDMDQAYDRLRRFEVQQVSTAPQLLPVTIPQAAGIRAFYFRDPDGHPLEILQFPPDKGDPKWHRRDGRLFLGIDHTAIVVQSTAASLAFYRDTLGLRVAGESMNFGTEQEHLNNVPGARLHITALRAAQGPGIEFLEYLAPRDGRPFPADSRPNDLIHWQTTVLVAGPNRAAKALGRGNPVELPDSFLGFRQGFMVRDPDGHAVQLAGN